MNTLLIIENKDENMERDVIPFFKLKELKCKCGECTLSFFDWELLRSLYILRMLYGKPLHINSCYRCPSHNRSKEVGGEKYSYHMRGLAVDIALPTDAEQRIELLRLIALLFTFHKIYDDKNFVHACNKKIPMEDL